MRKVYYNLMRNPAIALPCFVVCVSHSLAWCWRPTAAGIAKDRVTGVARRLDDLGAAHGPIPRNTRRNSRRNLLLPAGVLAVQVAFRNDSDESVRVNLERIRLTVQLGDDNRQEVPSLNSEELADAVLKPKGKDPTASRGKLPIPVGGGSKGGRDKHWTELQTEAQNAGVPTSVVAAHSTVQGLLYFRSARTVRSVAERASLRATACADDRAVAP